MKLNTELDDDCSWSLAIVDAIVIDAAVGSDVAVEVEQRAVGGAAVLCVEPFGE